MRIEDLLEGARVDTARSGWRTRVPKPEAAAFDAERRYGVQLETTKGNIRLRLMPQVAPMHVTSFLYLSKLGFHDGLAFHRVIPRFMAQGGCPLGTGTGNPGYEFAGEFEAGVKHDRPGLLSMANAGAGTDGSQFFLTFVPAPWLDGKHTIFGEVVEGTETLKALEAAGTESGRPREPLKLERVSIEIG